MEEAMLQLQFLVPLMRADASLTANLKRGETLEFELASDIKLPETSSLQKIALKYGRISSVIELSIMCYYWSIHFLLITAVSLVIPILGSSFPQPNL